MDLDRGSLARLDRKLLAGLGQDETCRNVRVPVTAAKWSAWKRCCDSAGISMGRAIVALIDRELISVFGISSDDGSPVLLDWAGEKCQEARPARLSGEDAPVADEGPGWSGTMLGSGIPCIDALHCSSRHG